MLEKVHNLIDAPAANRATFANLSVKKCAGFRAGSHVKPARSLSLPVRHCEK